MPTNNSSKWNDKLTDANFPNIQYLAFEIKIFIKKKFMFTINMFVLQIYQQNSYSCWLKQNQWLLTDRQTTVVLTIASLTVGTTWEQNQTRVNTPCTILQNDRNSMQVTRQHMVARQHWNQINAWKNSQTYY